MAMLSPADPEDETLSLGATRRPVLVGAALLVAGLLIGFVIGNQGDDGKPSAAPTVTATATAVVIVSARPSASPSNRTVDDGPDLAAGPNRCARQTGAHTLELGVELVNTSLTTVELVDVSISTPVGGLSPRTVGVGTCAQLGGVQSPGDTQVQPGETVGLVMTARVVAHCPAPYPVQFSVTYRIAGRVAHTEINGFADLGCGALLRLLIEQSSTQR